MRRFPTVLATLFVATSAIPAIAQAETNPGGLAAEHNRCSPAQFSGERQQYIKLYHKVRRNAGARAPGRNIVCNGMRTKHGPRSARIGEIRPSIVRLKGMLVTPASPTAGTVDSAAGVPKSTLDAIAACESHGDPAAIGGRGAYRGMFQMTFHIWGAVGGQGDPAAASAQEQYKRAALVYTRYGSGQWPVCGR